MSNFPTPIVNPINREFWDGLKADTFLIQRCDSCGEYNYPPRPACPICSSTLTYEETEGTGTVYTYGIVHRPNVPSVFDAKVPICLAVIELDEGPRVVTNIVGVDPDHVSIGDRVEIGAEQVTDDVAVLEARLLSE